MKKITTVLFDFDGTVMNTNDVIIGSWQHTFRILEGKERPVEEIVKTFGEPLVVTMGKFFPNIPTEESIEIYRSFHRDKFHDLISMYDGVVELLEELKNRGYKTAVVTSRIKESTYIGLDKYDIAKYFDYVITCDDTDKHKPHPEPVLIAMNKLGSTADESIMVGDTMFDILCARNAGVKSILVGWALAVSEEEKVGNDKPDYIAQTAESILEILED